jgi:hypothetical protein
MFVTNRWPEPIVDYGKSLFTPWYLDAELVNRASARSEISSTILEDMRNARVVALRRSSKGARRIELIS